MSSLVNYDSEDDSEDEKKLEEKSIEKIKSNEEKTPDQKMEDEWDTFEKMIGQTSVDQNQNNTNKGFVSYPNYKQSNVDGDFKKSNNVGNDHKEDTKSTEPEMTKSTRRFCEEKSDDENKKKRAYDPHDSDEEEDDDDSDDTSDDSDAKNDDNKDENKSEGRRSCSKSSESSNSSKSEEENKTKPKESKHKTKPKENEHKTKENEHKTKPKESEEGNKPKPKENEEGNKTKSKEKRDRTNHTDANKEPCNSRKRKISSDDDKHNDRDKNNKRKKSRSRTPPRKQRKKSSSRSRSRDKDRSRHHHHSSKSSSSRKSHKKRSRSKSRSPTPKRRTQRRKDKRDEDKLRERDRRDEKKSSRRHRKSRSRSHSRRRHRRHRSRSSSDSLPRFTRAVVPIVKPQTTVVPPTKPIPKQAMKGPTVMPTMKSGTTLPAMFADLQNTDFKEQLKAMFLEAQTKSPDEIAKGIQLDESKLMTAKEKKSALPLNNLNPLAAMVASGSKATPQQALSQTMAAMHAKVQEITGVAVPKYYNPSAVNPLKYAEQLKKRKMLWSKNKDPGAAEVEKEVESKPDMKSQLQWTGTSFSADQDGKMAAKFKKLMGIKGEGSNSLLADVDLSKLTEDQRKKQEELFQQLDREYEFARMATHTCRGVGFGFASHNLPGS